MPSNNNLDTWFLIAVFFFVGSRKACGDGELIVADFEGGTYLGWTICRDSFRVGACDGNPTKSDASLGLCW
jgi:hypothetical protein